MIFRKTKKQKAAPEPRLLPLNGYPKGLSEEQLDRVDKRLREELHTIPVEPDEYLDREGEWWTLDADGGWTDPHGERRSRLYTPAVSFAGPFTKARKTPVLATESRPDHG